MVTSVKKLLTDENINKIAVKGGDINDIAYRKALVDIFVSKIYLFDDKVVIICNAGENSKIEIPIGELCGSSMRKVVGVEL